MNPSDLEKDLAAGAFKPLYVFHGQDELLKERYLARMIDIVPEGMRDFNLERLSAEDCTPAAVLEHARTMPFMTRPRLVILRGADKYSAEELAVFTAYLDAPNEDSCLVMILEKMDQRLKFFKEVRKKQLDIDFEAPRGRGLITWVRNAMSLRGMNMGEEAAQALVEQLGDDLMELDREVEKLSLYALGRKSVTVEDVREAARVGHKASVFKLGDALGMQDSARALAELNDLLFTDHHLPILAMMIRHFRLLLRAKSLEGRRLAPNDAASALGVPPFAARQYMEQARGLGLEDVKKGLVRLQEANLTLISSPAPPKAVMESLVLDLARLRRRRQPGL